MPETHDFYRVSDYGDRLNPADSIKIEHYIYAQKDGDVISPLINVPLERLQTMRSESSAAEQGIFDNLREASRAWEKQAAQTLRLDMAIEYVKTPPVKHTANKWVKDDYRQNMSNMVYTMSYSIYEKPNYSRTADKSKPAGYELTWYVYTNNPDGRRGQKIAGQDRKSFEDKADMEKYLAGRIKAYSHLFTEISPPIPKDYAHSFKVNGQLLPGYAVQGQEPPATAAVIENGGDSISTQNTEPRKELKNMDTPLNLKVSNKEQHDAGNGEGVWLKLPATAEQLQTALARIGVKGGEQGKDYIITGIETPIPAIEKIPLENARKAGIDELNFLAARLEMFGKEHVDKLNAASEIMAGQGGDVHHLIEYTFCPEFYKLYPDIHTHEQLGEYLFEKSGIIQIPDEWAAAVDREKLGQLAAAQEKGLFTAQGYIVENGTEEAEWQTITDIPQEYRITPKADRPERGAGEKPAPNIEYDSTPAPAAPAIPATHAPAAPIVLVSDNPRDRMKEITDKLESGIKGIFDSEQYKLFLKTLSKFHNYSFNNCMLIAMQKPEASFVAGFNAWRDDFKRQVMKGEKGIKILAPAPFKTTKSVDAVDRDGRPVYDKDGKRVKEEKEITVPAFKITSVFDVSQTEGEPLPQIGVNELTGSVDKYKDFFAALEKTSRVPIAFEAITGGAQGYYHQAEKRIAIQEGMSELQTLKTAIHEIAHSRLHDIDGNAAKDTPRPDRRTREVESESIAYAVCQHYGLNTQDYSFGYIAEWSGGKQLDVLRASLDTIRKEADAIITEVDKHFAEIMQNKEQAAERPAPERQPGWEKWSEPATPENAPEHPGVPSDDIKTYLPQRGDTFTIYQLKDGDGTRDIRFEPFSKLEAAGLAVAIANYDKIYSAPLEKDMTPEKIFFAFNMDRPEDFKGHSLSLSDVIVMNRDGKETAFYVDSKGFKELPGFIPAKEQAREKPMQPIDLKAVADYLQKQYDYAKGADPDKQTAPATVSIITRRLEQVNERVPENHPQLKALLANAAQSTDLPMLKERMSALQNDFTRHYSTAVQMTVDTGGKAEPKTPPATPVRQNEHAPAPKAPAQGENVAAIENKVKAGETINLSDLSNAMKADKQAAQTAQQGKTDTVKSAPSKSQPVKSNYTRTAPSQTGQARTYGKPAPAKSSQPSIKEQLAEGKKQLAAQKSAPSRAVNKNAALGG